MAFMADLVYIYWGDCPSVAEPPEASPPTTGASATTDTNRLCNEVLAPLVGVHYET